MDRNWQWKRCLGDKFVENFPLAVFWAWLRHVSSQVLEWWVVTMLFFNHEVIHMKKYFIGCLIVAASIGPVCARNTEYKLPFSEVLEAPELKGDFDDSVKFLLGEQRIPAGAERKGDGVISRIAKGGRYGDDRTVCKNAPSDITGCTVRSQQNIDISACKNAAINALMAMRERARQLGANAIVDIVSFYKENVFSSAEQYECHAGGTGGHLTFRAVYVFIPKN